MMCVGACVMVKKQYYVRREGSESGPWYLSEVRRLLSTTLDPVTQRPRDDYEVRDSNSVQWSHPTALSEFRDIYHADSLVRVSTMPDSPRAKVVKR